MVMLKHFALRAKSHTEKTMMLHILLSIFADNPLSSTGYTGLSAYKRHLSMPINVDGLSQSHTGILSIILTRVNVCIL